MIYKIPNMSLLFLRIAALLSLENITVAKDAESKNSNSINSTIVSDQNQNEISYSIPLTSTQESTNNSNNTKLPSIDKIAKFSKLYSDPVTQAKVTIGPEIYISKDTLKVVDVTTESSISMNGNTIYATEHNIKYGNNNDDQAVESSEVTPIFTRVQNRGGDFDDNSKKNKNVTAPMIKSQQINSTLSAPPSYNMAVKHLDNSNYNESIHPDFTYLHKFTHSDNEDTIVTTENMHAKIFNQSVSKEENSPINKQTQKNKQEELDSIKQDHVKKQTSTIENISLAYQTNYNFSTTPAGIINPYPYGPNLPYDENLRPIEPASIKDLLPDEGFLYEYEYSQETSTTNEKVHLVKTEKPTILFHFQKPGYSPKIPEGSLPPTRSPTPSDPWNCNLKCPKYTLLDWNPEYDIRQYPATAWISTVIISKNRILAELEGYMRIQDYFYGLNDRGELLNLTAPYITQIKHGRHPAVLEETSEYAVSLFIDHKEDSYDYSLPTPISNEVLIERLDKKTIFVTSFEANVWELTEEFLKEKAVRLMKKLHQHGEAFLDRYFYLAAYSRPELYQPVYFELWIYATKFRSSVSSVRPMPPGRRPTPSKLTLRTSRKLCRGIECPPFEVLRTYRYGIQKRRYFDGMFATTILKDCQFSTASVWKGFMPLHLYKHGVNSHMEVVEATRPIALVHINENYYSHCPQNMTMAIYIPKRLHTNPPSTGYAAPTVVIKPFQNIVVYAYTIGGYLLEPNRVRKELSDLKYRLTEFGACFKDTEYYVVVYDFIVRYHGRQNEIWIVAENCKATNNG